MKEWQAALGLRCLLFYRRDEKVTVGKEPCSHRKVNRMEAFIS